MGSAMSPAPEPEAEYRPFPNEEARNHRQASIEVPLMAWALGLPTGGRVLEVGCGRGVALPGLARLLGPSRLAGLDIEPALLAEARALGMEALVELYDADNLDRVLASGAALIGVNNRDLRTFVTRLEHTLDLAPRVPADRCLVSESGIRTRADVLRLEAAGVKAILVGESLMRAADIGAQLDALRGVAPA